MGVRRADFSTMLTDVDRSLGLLLYDLVIHSRRRGGWSENNICDDFITYSIVQSNYAFKSYCNGLIGVKMIFH